MYHMMSFHWRTATLSAAFRPPQIRCWYTCMTCQSTAIKFPVLASRRIQHLITYRFHYWIVRSLAGHSHLTLKQAHHLTPSWLSLLGFPVRITIVFILDILSSLSSKATPQEWIIQPKCSFQQLYNFTTSTATKESLTLFQTSKLLLIWRTSQLTVWPKLNSNRLSSFSRSPDLESLLSLR